MSSRHTAIVQSAMGRICAVSCPGPPWYFLPAGLGLLLLAARPGARPRRIMPRCVEQGLLDPPRNSSARTSRVDESRFLVSGARETVMDRMTALAARTSSVRSMNSMMVSSRNTRTDQQIQRRHHVVGLASGRKITNDYAPEKGKSVLTMSIIISWTMLVAASIDQPANLKNSCSTASRSLPPSVFPCSSKSPLIWKKAKSLYAWQKKR